MNINAIRRLMPLLLCASLLIVAGCAINIPVSTSMKVQNIPPQKIQKNILVVMSKEQAEKIILFKKSALANPFSFEAGKSVSSNLTQAMQYKFAAADFSNEVPAAGKYDYVLVANIKDAKFDFPFISVADKKVNVYIDYELFDAKQVKLLQVSTDGSSEVQAATAEKVLFFFPALYSIRGNIEIDRIGNSWDLAVINSITQLMAAMDRHFNIK